MAVANIQILLGEALRLHQAGQLEQAALLYRKVLAAHPNSADALHLLGMIALQQGQAQTAADLIRKAIALHDREASYHFHLALALQTLEDMDGAVAGYRRALNLKPDDPDIYNNMGNALAAQGRLEDALQAFRHLLTLQPGNAVAHSNLGNVQRDLGLRDQAEASFRKAVGLQPGFACALINLGNLHCEKGEADAAESCYRRALALAPRDPAAQCGLGVALRQLGRHAEAVSCYRAVLACDPGHAETLINLAGALWESGALDEAEPLYRRVLDARPRDPGILDNLAALLLARGANAEAMEMIHRSFAIRETPRARKLFAEAARRADFQSGEMRHAMVRALTEPWDRPGMLVGAAARLIRSHPAIGPLIARADAAWPCRLPLGELLGDAGFAPLADDALLGALLTSAPNTDIPLERFLSLLRGAMLRASWQNADPQAERFAAALAQQCFINEYVFLADDAEMAAASALRDALETGNAMTPMQLLLAATCFPLHRLANADALLQRAWPAPVEPVLTQQVRDPREEERLRADIPRLTGIEDPVSRLVQDQYEENPYPRWVRAASATPDTIVNFLGGKFPLARFERHPGRTMQDILIAGCGTGQRSIAMAQKFGDRHMLAVDLSRASLGYAKRKSDEMGLKIAYGQADILELGAMERRFDLIESLGVLHHLADPEAGWRTLLSLLRPNGFMLLGLYSESARRPVVEARARIAARGLGGSADDIRGFRQELIGNSDRHSHASILDSEDFFSLSACRDLLFHVHERRTTLGDIARFVESHNLRLLGFELDDAVLGAYRKRFPQDEAANDLGCWEMFEADHPGLFGGLYTFWLQKPA